MTKSE
jgi:hypothetical protein